MNHHFIKTEPFPTQANQQKQETIDWKSKTCETCRYQLSNMCARFPPQVIVRLGNRLCTSRPTVKAYGGWYQACAEYQPAEESQ